MVDRKQAPPAPCVLGKRELTERVVTASGIKKRAVRPVIEALLQELGDALSRGDQVNLQPFGKAQQTARREQATSEVLEIRLRRPRPSRRPQESLRNPLAKAAE
jgi:DNA-binding protein HU-alpha